MKNYKLTKLKIGANEQILKVEEELEMSESKMLKHIRSIFSDMTLSKMKKLAFTGTRFRWLVPDNYDYRLTEA